MPLLVSGCPEKSSEIQLIPETSRLQHLIWGKSQNNQSSWVLVWLLKQKTQNTTPAKTSGSPISAEIPQESRTTAALLSRRRKHRHHRHTHLWKQASWPYLRHAQPWLPSRPIALLTCSGDTEETNQSDQRRGSACSPGRCQGGAVYCADGERRSMSCTDGTTAHNAAQ